MIKNIQIKIVILFILVGVILVGSLGGLYIHNLQELNNEVLSNNAGNIQEISNLIINQISNTKVMVINATICRQRRALSASMPPRIVTGFASR